MQSLPEDGKAGHSDSTQNSTRKRLLILKLDVVHSLLTHGDTHIISCNVLL